METEQRQWLSPSAALNRFTLPQDLLPTALPDARKRLRYGFQIGDIGLLINADTTSEVIEPVPICPLPNTPEWLLGLINLRGNLVPVFNLRQLLNLEESSQETFRFLILGSSEQTVGFPIVSLPYAPDLSNKLSRLPPLPEALKTCVSEAYGKDGAVWLEFDHRSFFQTLTERIASHF